MTSFKNFGAATKFSILNEQIDNLKKNSSNLSKIKQTLEAENVDLANEVKNLNQLNGIH